jgi:uncharacterized protein YbaR (Trm112 family)
MLGVPQESREAYDMLCDSGIIDVSLRDRLKAMIGFRNIAVHDYIKLNLAVVRSIIETRLGDFRTFGEAVLNADEKNRRRMKMIEQSLLDILACPQCKAAIRQDEEKGVLICDQCRLKFPVRDGIPVMLVDEAESF